MLFAFIPSLILFPFAGLLAKNSDHYVISFGSCARENRPQPIWTTIADRSPNIFLFIGDNIYADTNDMNVMKRKYDLLAAIPQFRNFRSRFPILATWDDHDYGVNDGGAEYEQRIQSQSLFLEFWKGPNLTERKKRHGIYHSYHEKFDDLTIQYIMLDTRYHRSPLVKKKSGYGYTENLDPKATILGDEQWKWLNNQLQKPADVRVIASSIQFLSSFHRFEKWSNFPHEKQKMIDTIIATRAKGVIFISGDRHLGELSVLHHPLIGYPIFDLTSSGLTDSVKPQISHEYNPSRLPNTTAFKQRNFGIIQIKKGGQHQVELRLVDQNGDDILSHRLKLSDLK